MPLGPPGGRSFASSPYWKKTVVACPSGLTEPEKLAAVVLVVAGLPGTAAGFAGGGGGGGAPLTNSYAPMSHLPPAGCGRATPRWSVVSGCWAASVHDPASTAGLPAASACVGVVPPLF